MPKHRRLLRQLSDAGMAPRYLFRIEAELRDHYADIEQEAFAAENSSEEAAREAHRRLGDDDTIAAEFLGHPELKLWVYRSPALLFLLELVASVILILLAPVQLVFAKRREIGRFSAACCASAALLCALLLGMQSVLNPERSFTGTAAISVERQLAAGPETTATEYVRESAVPLALIQHRMKSPERVALDASTNSLPRESFANMSEELSFIGAALHDGDYLPIVKVAPVYPSSALSQGLEGFVVVEFTVARSGAVKDVVVVESTDVLFERAAVEAARKFKYRPRIIAGRTVEVSGVRNRITFDIAA